jgi:hypothetical protein
MVWTDSGSFATNGCHRVLGASALVGDHVTRCRSASSPKHLAPPRATRPIRALSLVQGRLLDENHIAVSSSIDRWKQPPHATVLCGLGEGGGRVALPRPWRPQALRRGRRRGGATARRAPMSARREAIRPGPEHGWGVGIQSSSQSRRPRSGRTGPLVGPSSGLGFASDQPPTSNRPAAPMPPPMHMLTMP